MFKTNKLIELYAFNDLNQQEIYAHEGRKELTLVVKIIYNDCYCALKNEKLH